jgi:hypothetical protein
VPIGTVLLLTRIGLVPLRDSRIEATAPRRARRSAAPDIVDGVGTARKMKSARAMGTS